jgi:hypothetical protein
LTNGFKWARMIRVLSECGPVAQLGARFHGMEEVIGSIPIRSTNYFQQLRRCERSGHSSCVMVCVITPILLLFETASIAVRFASMRTWEYRSSIMWVRHPPEWTYNRLLPRNGRQRRFQTGSQRLLKEPGSQKVGSYSFQYAASPFEA